MLGKAGATIVCSSADKNIASMIPITIGSAAASLPPPDGIDRSPPSGRTCFIRCSTRGRPAVSARGSLGLTATASASAPGVCQDSCPSGPLPPPFLPSCRLGETLRPTHDVILEVLIRHIVLRCRDLPPHRNSGGVNRLAV